MSNNIDKIKIKGIEYQIKLNDNFIISGELLCDGICDKEKKVIEFSKKCPEYSKERTIRHELIHAFLHESGFSSFESNESLVDWLAFHIPQIEEAYNQISTVLENDFSSIGD